MKLFKDPTEQYSVIFLVISYIFGIILHLIPDLRPLIIKLTELYLLLMNILVFAFGLLNNHRNLAGFTFWCLITTLCIFLIGIAAINTGVIFGTYVYGVTLPTKVADIPLIMPFYWAMIILAAYGFLSKVFPQRNIRALFAALIVLTLDLIIEPVASKLGYWAWESNTIPYHNYLAWFFISLIFAQILALMKIHARSIIFKAFLIMQFLFYTVLNIFL
jgi:bisanhydrobacterioruberin hydratase